MFLELRHGRTDPKADMEDQGFDGPVIGPITSVRELYGSDLRLEFGHPTDTPCRFIKRVGHDLLVFGDSFFGEWVMHEGDGMYQLPADLACRYITYEEVAHSTWSTPGMPDDLADLHQEIVAGEPSKAVIEGDGELKAEIEALYAEKYAIEYVLGPAEEPAPLKAIKAVMQFSDTKGEVDDEEMRAKAQKYLVKGWEKVESKALFEREISEEPPESDLSEGVQVTYKDGLLWFPDGTSREAPAILKADIEGGKREEDKTGDLVRLMYRYNDKKADAQKLAKHYLLHLHGKQSLDTSSEVEGMIDSIIEAAIARTKADLMGEDK
jgi:hypothetical protein